MASQVNVRNCIRAATQRRLDLAWKMKDKSIDELAAKMGALKKTARYYQRMVEMGTKKARPLDDAAWQEVRQEIYNGLDTNELALRWGWVPQAVRLWVIARKKNEPSAAQMALRLPFARWGELVDNTTRGV